MELIVVGWVVKNKIRYAPQFRTWQPYMRAALDNTLNQVAINLIGSQLE